MVRKTEDSSSDSSSSEEEEVKEEQNLSNASKHHKQQPTKQSDDDSENEEESSEEDEEDDEDEEVNPSITPEKKISPPKPISTVADEESGSETDSAENDKTRHSPEKTDFTVKPILSKPAVNSKKAPSTSAVKRPAESHKGDSKEKKARVSNLDEEKKSAINRLWSEKDEIALLQGMIDYQSKKGVDPYTDIVNFHEFVKGLVHVDVSKSQVSDKIRRLKKKYQNNADKGENGEDPVFSRPHDYKSFELSKKIWGNSNVSGVDDGVKSNNVVKGRKSGRIEDSKAIVNQEKQGLKDESVADKNEFWCMYPQLNESLNYDNSYYLSIPEGGRCFMKENMYLIGNKKAKELNEKWKDLFMSEVGLYSKRLQLIEEQTKVVLNAMKSSKS